jgi:hypothetical protein
MSSDLKNGVLWTPPTFADDGSQDDQPGYLTADGTHGLNGILAEIASVQAYAANGGHNVANVRDFGAIGDGTADDRAAIQSAVNSSAKYVYFPPGTYRVSDTIVVGSGGGSGKKLLGGSPGTNAGFATKIVWGGSDQRSTPNKAVVELNYGFGGGMHGLGISTSGTNTGIWIHNTENGWSWAEDSCLSELLFYGTPGRSCIKADWASGMSLLDIIYDNTSDYGLDAWNCYGLKIRNNTFFNRIIAGVLLDGDDLQYNARHLIQGCDIALNGSAWVLGAHSEPLPTGAGVIVGANCKTVNITGNMFHGNAAAVRILGGVGGHMISGNSFDFHQTDTIQVVGTKNVCIDGNMFRGSEGEGDMLDGYGHYTLKTSGTCRGVVFTNNTDFDDWSGGVLLQSGTTYSLIDNYVHQGGKTVTNQGGVTNTVGRVVG